MQTKRDDLMLELQHLNSDRLNCQEIELCLTRARQERAEFIGVLVNSLLDRAGHSLHAIAERMHKPEIQTTH